MTLPFPVKEDKISTNFKNGVLELRLPKGEEVTPKRIEVKAQIPQGGHTKPERKPKEKAS